jgi:putative holliday junction resolvase
VSRILGVDLGARRIGLALSDPLGVTASPHAVIERSDSIARDHRAIVDAAGAADADRIVVGLPLSLSGELGPAARAVLDEVAQLRAAAGDDLTVEVFDERLTTVIAERSLVEARMRREARRRVIDKVAAAVMLQSYLEAPR